MPVSIFTVVDLPAPLGPRSPTSCPLGISRSRPRTASTLPKRLESWRRRITRPPPREARGGSRLPDDRQPRRRPRPPAAVHRLRPRDGGREVEACLVGELGVRVDALLAHAQALAHGDDLAEEGLDRNGLLLRAGLARLHHELAARPALADRARHRLLGVQHGAYRLHDLAEVLLVERHCAPQRTAATSKSRPASTAEEKGWPSANVRPASKRSPCRVKTWSVHARGSMSQYSRTPFRS